jgi:hypothetical protein
MSEEELEFDLVCFEEAWEYLNDNYPALATSVQKMVRKGMTPENIKRRAITNMGVHREPLALRCENAAKYLERHK